MASTSAPAASPSRARRCLLGAVVRRCHPVSRSPRRCDTPGSLPAGAGSSAGLPWRVVNAWRCLTRRGCQAAPAGSSIAARESPLDSCALLLSQPSEQIWQSSDCLWADERCRGAGKASCGHRPLEALDLMLVFFQSLYLPHLLDSFSLERVSGCSCTL